VSPSQEYARRLGLREAEVARLARVHERIGNARLALGAVTLLLAWFVFGERAVAPFWLLIPVATFVALVFSHASVARARTQAQRAPTK
jgi:hypothetical protein